VTASARRSRLASRVIQPLLYIIGMVLASVGVAMVSAVFVALAHGENQQAWGIALAAAVTVGVGVVLARGLGRPGPITVRVGFASVGLAWFVISAFGSLPYLFTGGIASVTDAYFETASGFTTTGASILADPAALPYSLLWWRALTQWLGGMGVIVLSVAVLPLLGSGGMQLARAESPGHTPDRLTPRFQDTAKRLWLLYAAFTALQILLLWAGEMDLFESAAHAFTTMSTGGFSTRVESIAAFSPYTQWIITVFMLIAGCSFALHFRALRKPSEYWRSAEFRLYLAIVLGAVVIVTGGLLRDVPSGESIREAAFTSASLITTTGYSSADFGSWRPALQVFAFGLMFLGGMAGSTAGAVKVFRVGILSKAALADIRRIVHPRGIFTLRFGKDRVSEPVVEAIQSFFLFYMFIFMTATFLTTFIDANLTESLDLVTAASAVAASIGNIGPGLGDVGPAGNYGDLPSLVKWLLSSLMIVGRLEIFPVLVLFTKDLWKR
jgi:trk system potassium uptake protein TrkH